MDRRQEAADILLALVETMYPQDVLMVVAAAAARGALPRIKAGELTPDEAWDHLSEALTRTLAEALEMMHSDWETVIAQTEFATSVQEGIDNIESLLGPE